MKIIKALLLVLGVLVLAAGGLVGYLTLTEYRPDDIEQLEVTQAARSDNVRVGERLDVLSFNTGYCGLGRDQDFFMDGGTMVRPESEQIVRDNMNGILSELARQDADIYLLQEVDFDSYRSYYVNQADTYRHGLSLNMAVAYNYKCDFVPFPWPPIGKVNSGILTTADYAVQGGSAERIALPCPFSWPVRTANLKRCLLVSRYHIPDLDKELVVVNLHLEAYDDGEGKAAQTAMLFDILESEYAEGNYVIAGGDFNQTFPGTLDKWPIRAGEVWTPGVLEAESLPEGWSYVYDDSSPTCRLLDEPYDAQTSQHYVLDGFIVSPNIDVRSVKTQSLGFKYSDHNPVVVEIGFKEV